MKSWRNDDKLWTMVGALLILPIMGLTVLLLHGKREAAQITILIMGIISLLYSCVLVFLLAFAQDGVFDDDLPVYMLLTINHCLWIVTASAALCAYLP